MKNIFTLKVVLIFIWGIFGANFIKAQNLDSAYFLSTGSFQTKTSVAVGNDGDFIALPSFNLDSNFTIETWFKLDGNIRAGNTILDFHNGTVLLRFSTTESIEFRAFSATKIRNFIDFNLNPNNWNHYTLAGNNSQVKLYINGILVDSVITNVPVNTILNNNYLAKSNNNNVSIQGQFSDFRIWKLVKDSIGINIDMNNRPLGNEMGLFYYLPLSNPNFSNYSKNLLNSTKLGNSAYSSIALSDSAMINSVDDTGARYFFDADNMYIYGTYFFSNAITNDPINFPRDLSIRLNNSGNYQRVPINFSNSYFKYKVPASFVGGSINFLKLYTSTMHQIVSIYFNYNAPFPRFKYADNLALGTFKKSGHSDTAITYDFVNKNQFRFRLMNATGANIKIDSFNGMISWDTTLAIGSYPVTIVLKDTINPQFNQQIDYTLKIIPAYNQDSARIYTNTSFRSNYGIQIPTISFDTTSTIELWSKLDIVIRNYQYLFYFEDSSNEDNFFYAGIFNLNSRPYLFVASEGTVDRTDYFASNSIYLDDVGINPYEWNHFAVVLNPKLTVYINGKPVDIKGPNTKKFPVAFNRNLIGYWYDNPFQRLSEFRLWQQALDSTDIKNNYQLKINPFSIGLEYYLPLNDFTYLSEDKPLALGTKFPNKSQSPQAWSDSAILRKAFSYDINPNYSYRYDTNLLYLYGTIQDTLALGDTIQISIDNGLSWINASVINFTNWRAKLPSYFVSGVIKTRHVLGDRRLNDFEVKVTPYNLRYAQDTIYKSVTNPLGIAGSSGIPKLGYNLDSVYNFSFTIEPNSDQISTNSNTGAFNWTDNILPNRYTIKTSAYNSLGGPTMKTTVLFILDTLRHLQYADTLKIVFNRFDSSVAPTYQGRFPNFIIDSPSQNIGFAINPLNGKIFNTRVVAPGNYLLKIRVQNFISYSDAYLPIKIISDNPTIGYTKNDVYYRPGVADSSMLPNFYAGGDTSFKFKIISTAVAGISIDSLTGRIKWASSLSPGTYPLNIRLYNTIDSFTTHFTIHIVAINIDTAYASAASNLNFYNFNFQSGYLSLPNLNLGQNFSVETWFKLNYDIGKATIFDFGNTVSLYKGGYNVSTIVYKAYSNDITIPWNSIPNYNIYAWNHYAITVENNMARLFINGLEVSSTPTTSTPGIIGNNRIGRSTVSTEPPTICSFYEFRIWNKKRTPQDVASTYNIKLLPFTDSLYYYLPLSATRNSYYSSAVGISNPVFSNASLFSGASPDAASLTSLNNGNFLFENLVKISGSLKDSLRDNETFQLSWDKGVSWHTITVNPGKVFWQYNLPDTVLGGNIRFRSNQAGRTFSDINIKTFPYRFRYSPAIDTVAQLINSSLRKAKPILGNNSDTNYRFRFFEGLPIDGRFTIDSLNGNITWDKTSLPRGLYALKVQASNSINWDTTSVYILVTYDTPSIQYPVNNVDIILGDTGRSVSPQIYTNEDTAYYIRLAQPLKGVTVDSLTGVIKWQGEFPIGLNTIPVVIFNHSLLQATDTAYYNIQVHPITKSGITNYTNSYVQLRTPAVANSTAGDFISLPNMSFGSNYTIETWFKLDNVLTNQRHYILRFNNNDYIIELSLNSGQFFWSTQTYNNILTLSSLNFGPNTWNHYAISVQNNGMASLYINGILRDAGGLGNMNPSLFNKNILGGQYNSVTNRYENTTQGQYSEFRIWGQSQSLADINRNLNLKINPKTFGLYYYLPLNNNTYLGSDTYILNNTILKNVCQTLDALDSVSLVSSAFDTGVIYHYDSTQQFIYITLRDSLDPQDLIQARTQFESVNTHGSGMGYYWRVKIPQHFVSGRINIRNIDDNSVRDTVYIKTTPYQFKFSPSLFTLNKDINTLDTIRIDIKASLGFNLDSQYRFSLVHPPTNLIWIDSLLGNITCDSSLMPAQYRLQVKANNSRGSTTTPFTLYVVDSIKNFNYPQITAIYANDIEVNPSFYGHDIRYSIDSPTGQNLYFGINDTTGEIRNSRDTIAVGSYTLKVRAQNAVNGVNSYCNIQIIADRPTIRYRFTNVNGIVGDTGYTFTPLIYAGGDSYLRYALAGNQISGIKIDSITGIMSWGSQLPIGSYTILAVIRNSNFSDTTTVILNINPRYKDTAILFTNTSLLIDESTINGINIIGYNNTQNYVQMPNFTLGDSFTVETWFKFKAGFDPLGKGFVRLFDFGTILVGSKVALAISNGGSLVYTAFNSNVKNFSKPANLDLFQWNHFALSYGNNIIRLYVNGVLLDSTIRVANEDPNVFLNENYLARPRENFAGTTAGHYADFRIWKANRSPKQIASNYNVAILPYSANLFYYLPFNDTTYLNRSKNLDSNTYFQNASTASGRLLDSARVASYRNLGARINFEADRQFLYGQYGAELDTNAFELIQINYDNTNIYHNATVNLGSHGWRYQLPANFRSGVIKIRNNFRTRQFDSFVVKTTPYDFYYTPRIMATNNKYPIVTKKPNLGFNIDSQYTFRLVSQVPFSSSFRMDSLTGEIYGDTNLMPGAYALKVRVDNQRGWDTSSLTFVYEILKAPTIAYSNDSVVVLQYQNGNSVKPDTSNLFNYKFKILSGGVNGIFIDSISGIVGWDSTVAIGDYNLSVAVNNYGASYIIGDTVSFKIRVIPSNINTISFYQNSVFKTSKDTSSAKSDYIQLPAFSLGDQFTIETWYKFDGKGSFLGNDIPRVFDFSQALNDFNLAQDDHIILGIGSLTQLNYYAYSRIYGTGTYNLNTDLSFWNHFAIVFNKNKVQFYVNGVKVSSPASENADFFNPDSLRFNFIGRSNVEAEGSKPASYSEFRLWKTARSSQDIYNNYQSKINPYSSQLFYYLPLTDTIYTTRTSPIANNTILPNASKSAIALKIPAKVISQYDTSAKYIRDTAALYVYGQVKDSFATNETIEVSFDSLQWLRATKLAATKAPKLWSLKLPNNFGSGLFRARSTNALLMRTFDTLPVASGPYLFKYQPQIQVYSNLDSYKITPKPQLGMNLDSLYHFTILSKSPQTNLIQINANSGEISWDSSLALGLYQLKIQASNSRGWDTTSITINYIKGDTPSIVYAFDTFTALAITGDLNYTSKPRLYDTLNPKIKLLSGTVGITVDSITGVISWPDTLAIGFHPLKIAITNNGPKYVSSDTVSLTIKIISPNTNSISFYANSIFQTTTNVTPASDGDYIMLPPLNLGTNFTIETWFKLNDNFLQDRTIRIFDFGTSIINSKIALGLNSSGQIIFRVFSNGLPIAITPPVNTNFKQWHHVAITVGNNQVYLYLDNVLTGSTSILGTENLDILLSNNYIARANDNNIGGSTPGQFFDFRVWKTTRTLQQITDYKSVIINPLSSGLVYHLPLSDDVYYPQTKHIANQTALLNKSQAAISEILPAVIVSKNDSGARYLRDTNGLYIYGQISDSFRMNETIQVSLDTMNWITATQYANAKQWKAKLPTNLISGIVRARSSVLNRNFDSFPILVLPYQFRFQQQFYGLSSETKLLNLPKPSLGFNVDSLYTFSLDSIVPNTADISIDEDNGQIQWLSTLRTGTYKIFAKATNTRGYDTASLTLDYEFAQTPQLVYSIDTVRALNNEAGFSVAPSFRDTFNSKLQLLNPTNGFAFDTISGVMSWADNVDVGMYPLKIKITNYGKYYSLSDTINYVVTIVPATENKISFYQNSSFQTTTRSYNAFYPGPVDYIRLPKLKLDSHFTIETWFKADYINGNQDRIFDFGFPYASKMFISFASQSTFNWDIFGRDSTLNFNNFNIDPLNWNHYAVSFKPDTAILYINGIQVCAYYHFTNTFYDTLPDNFIGRSNYLYYDAGVEAQFSDFKIWKTTRSASQIRNNFKPIISRFSSGLLYYLPLADDVYYPKTTSIKDSTLLYNVSQSAIALNQPSIVTSTNSTGAQYLRDTMDIEAYGEVASNFEPGERIEISVDSVQWVEATLFPATRQWQVHVPSRFVSGNIYARSIGAVRRFDSLPIATTPYNFNYVAQYLVNQIPGLAKPHIGFNLDSHYNYELLSSNTDAFSLHNTTGIITWNEEIPLQINKIKVLIQNARGADTAIFNLVVGDSIRNFNYNIAVKNLNFSLKDSSASPYLTGSKPKFRLARPNYRGISIDSLTGKIYFPDTLSIGLDSIQLIAYNYINSATLYYTFDVRPLNPILNYDTIQYQYFAGDSGFITPLNFNNGGGTQVRFSLFNNSNNNIQIDSISGIITFNNKLASGLYQIIPQIISSYPPNVLYTVKDTIILNILPYPDTLYFYKNSYLEVKNTTEFGSVNGLQLPSNLDFTGDYTIEFWYQCKLENPNYVPILDFRNAGGTTDGIFLESNSTSENSFHLWFHGAENYFDVNAQAFNLKQWNHYAIVYSNINQSLNFYVNGILVYTLSNVPEANNSNFGSNLLGVANNVGNNGFVNNGYYNEFRFWKLARTEQSINQFKNTAIYPSLYNKLYYYLPLSVNYYLADSLELLAHDTFINQSQAHIALHQPTTILNNNNQSIQFKQDTNLVYVSGLFKDTLLADEILQISVNRQQNWLNVNRVGFTNYWYAALPDTQIMNDTFYIRGLNNPSRVFSNYIVKTPPQNLRYIPSEFNIYRGIEGTSNQPQFKYGDAREMVNFIINDNAFPNYFSINNSGVVRISNTTPMAQYPLSISAQNRYGKTTTNYTINVIIPDSFLITTSVKNGTISTGLKIQINKDYIVNYSGTTGYIIDSIFINNVFNSQITQDSLNRYTFSNIRGDSSIRVVFKLKSFTISASSGVGGSITPVGNSRVLFGESILFRINAADSFFIDSVFVNGINTYNFKNGLELGKRMDSVAFTNVMADANFRVVFRKSLASKPPQNIVGTHGDAQAIISFNQPAQLNGSALAYYTLYVVGNNRTVTSLQSPITITGLTNDQAYRFYVTATNIWGQESLPSDTTGDIIPSANFRVVSTRAVNGSITNSVSTLIGSNVRITYTANTGYVLDSIFINNRYNAQITRDSVSGYTFYNIQADSNILVKYRIKIYSISASAGVGGSINPQGNFVVNYNAQQRFNFTANTGYEIESIYVNNRLIPNAPTYTMDSIRGDSSIQVNFKIQTFTISANSGSNGIISPQGNSIVNYGVSRAFNYTPSTGYQVDSIFINGIYNAQITADSLTRFTFTNVQSNGSIRVVFRLKTFRIVVTAGSGGIVNPGTTNYSYGSNQRFMINALDSYFIDSIFVNGSMVYGFANGSALGRRIDSVDFNDIIAAGSLRVLFRKAIASDAPHTIVGTNGNGQSIISFDEPMILNGSAIAYYTVYAAGASLKVQGIHSPITINGLTNGQPYRFYVTATNIWGLESAPSDTTATIIPSANIRVISTRVVNGDITNSVSTTLGSKVRITYSGNTGYVLDSIFINNRYSAQITRDSVSAYTFNNIQGDSNIVVKYRIKIFNITASAGIGGSINPQGTITADYNTSKTFSIMPLAGYLIDSIIINKRVVASTNSYTIQNIQGDSSIRVVFKIKTFSIVANSVNGSIEPVGTSVVNYDSTLVYNYSPNAGYVLDSVVVDGNVYVDSLNRFTFSSIRANHSLRVVFKLAPVGNFTITTSVFNGNISPSRAVLRGSNYRVTYRGNANTILQRITVNGIVVNDSTMGYTFNNITTNQSIAVVYSSIINLSYTISTSVANGSISPTTVVPYLGKSQITYSADLGYILDSVMVDGVLYNDSVSSYTFVDVNKNHTVRVVYKKISSLFGVNYFNITTRDNSCVGSINGSINIIPSDTIYNFRVNLQGVYNTVTSLATFRKSYASILLDTGTYNVCITLDGFPESYYQQCITAVIKQPLPITGYSELQSQSKQLTLNLQGASSYQVRVNGSVFTSNTSKIDVLLKAGLNTIEVNTDNVCQGAYTEEVFVSESIVVYPNPVNNVLNLFLSGDDTEAEVILSNESGSVLYQSQHNIPSNRLVKLNVSNYPKGVYFVSVNGRTLDGTYKILKL
ncbi:MAG: T9SS type A sorting domain-containing protein [Alphaproteobacteria bacterium]|nr:T9SS type A sorting domain-containing protein [Alphaproteobacteria bacterium]